MTAWADPRQRSTLWALQVFNGYLYAIWYNFSNPVTGAGGLAHIGWNNLGAGWSMAGLGDSNNGLADLL
jgi:hypothetical protein